MPARAKFRAPVHLSLPLVGAALLVIGQLCSACLPGGQNVPASPLAVEDGSGGAIVARAQDERLYMARLSSEGSLLWQAPLAGVRTKTAMLCPDGSGGAIAVWMAGGRQDPVGDDLYAQRVSASGESLWPEGGVPVCVAPGHEGLLGVAEDGVGGVMAVWWNVGDSCDGIYAQRLDASGKPRFGQDGARVAAVEACGAAYATSDRAGGAIITWEGRHADAPALYVQRLSSGGQPLWEEDGVPLATGASYAAAGKSRAVADGQGGAVVAWQGGPGGELRVERVSAQGQALWQDVTLSQGGTTEMSQLLADGQGGFIIGWTGMPGQSGLFVQKLDLVGAKVWSDRALSVSAKATENVCGFQIAGDGAGGAMAVWWAGESPSRDGNIRAQRVDAVGDAKWPAGGIAVYPEATRYQGFPCTISDGRGGMITTSLLGDTAQGARAYAQRVGPAGDLLWPRAAAKVIP